MSKENQLQIIVKESGLEASKAQTILEKFTDYFSIAAEWEQKAKSLVVTNEKQVAEMEMARTGRLFLREKRIAIEKTRKELKEQSLRESRAIDGISNVLKALIMPIEEYLDQQENFVEILEEKKAEAKRLEVERKMEEERIAQEKAEAAEQVRIRIENEKLKKEAVAKDLKMAKARKAQEAKLAEQQAKADAERKAIEDKARIEREKAEAERKAIEDKARKEREKAEAERKLAEEKARLEKEKQEKTLANERAKAKRLKELAEEKAKAKLEAQRKEKERLAKILKNQIECPKCHHKFQIKRRQQ